MRPIEEEEKEEEEEEEKEKSDDDEVFEREETDGIATSNSNRKYISAYVCV